MPQFERQVPSSSASSSSPASRFIRLSFIDRLILSFFLWLQVVIFFCFHRYPFLVSHDDDGEHPPFNHFAISRRRNILSIAESPSTNQLVASSAQEYAGENDNDLESSFAYVQSFHSFDRTIKFVHIPKTAGTAIEQVAAEHGIAWGNCMFKHRPKRKICPHPVGEHWPPSVGWWHIPSQFFPLANSNPYQDSELFGVIRDPIDRMVSEYYYTCTLKNKEWRPNHCQQDRLHDAEYMNSWLAAKVNANNDKNGEEVVGDHLALPYLMDNGHFVPQYEFIVGPNEIRYLDYVLVLDNHNNNTDGNDDNNDNDDNNKQSSSSSSLQQDFEKLMDAFQLPLTLRQMQSISSHEGEEEESDRLSKLTAQDLDEITLASLKKKYANDLQVLQGLQQQQNSRS